MIWNILSKFYDYFETIYNGKVYKGIGKEVAKNIISEDYVLECACGTGSITKYLAPNCKKIIATDFSDGMLKQVHKKLVKFSNLEIYKADINKLEYSDEIFDKVVAGNVIHLLDKPENALSELMRVCKKGGMIIIPTYINLKQKFMPKLLTFIGVKFARQFNFESYKNFFIQLGYKNVEYTIVEGRMPCAIALIKKN
ncbi:MAG: class I SAM-dependent methyltransferase [Bacteroidales bacterium]|nr:class I SAM-dependent methyltransferase [Bacteroidales bacterium]